MCKEDIKLQLIYFFQAFCSGIVFYLAIFLSKKGFFGAEDIGLILSATFLGSIIGNFLSGYFIDKNKENSLAKNGLLFQAIGFLIFGEVNNIYAAYLLMLIVGFGNSLVLISISYLLTQKYEGYKKTSIIGRQFIISNLGMVIAPMLLGYLSDEVSRYLFVAISIFLVGMIFTINNIKSSSKTQVKTDNLSRTTQRALNIPVLASIVSFSLMGIIYAIHRIGFPLYLESKDYSSIQTGYLNAVNPILIVSLQSLLIRSLKKNNEYHLIIFGLFLMGFSYLFLNISSAFISVMTTIIFMTLGEMLISVYSQSIIFKKAPEDKRGLYFSIYKLAYSLLGMSSTILAGFVIEQAGYQFLWKIPILISTIGVAVYLMVAGRVNFLTTDTDTASEKF
ncbi:major facilitator family transporter [Legionella geestiana]|uniref:Major facilitator family transporter n=1 Tax=Legionella geestiana TaxID=45065 RepID=A0A0W0U438_9GAMM|nr:MFS transporter [Legionella geestiana]KTD02375.1 major facilitator family transporter [Legionella geestiana]QBS12151.1 MFS transporter [Legionella geestiana]STX53121.1 major facilitator family transporter [Legionella geestiana]